MSSCAPLSLSLPITQSQESVSEIFCDIPTNMIRDLFVQMTHYLSQADLAKLPQMNHRIYHHTAIARSRISQLSLNLSKSIPSLNQAVTQYPVFTHLRLENPGHADLEKIAWLAQTLQGRQIVQLETWGIEITSQDSLSQFVQLIVGLNTSRLQALDLRHINWSATQMVEPVTDLLIPFFNRCQQLTSVRLAQTLMSGRELTREFVNQRVLAVLRNLPVTIQFLAPNYPLNNEIVDLLVQRFDPEILEGCDLDFSHFTYNTDLSLEKKWQILRFLPLSKMKHVQIYGDFGVDMFHYIAYELAKNESLETLRFRFNQINLFCVIHFIESLNYRNLRSLSLLYRFPKQRIDVGAYLARKLAVWPNLTHIRRHGTFDNQVETLRETSFSDIDPNIDYFTYNETPYVYLKGDHLGRTQVVRIWEQLKANEQLRSVYITGFSLSTDDVIRFLHVIRSNQIEEIILESTIAVDSVKIQKYIETRMHAGVDGWHSLRSLKIGPDIRWNAAETLDMTPLTAQSPLRAVLKRFAYLHNRNGFNHQINPSEVLEHFSQHRIPPEPLMNLERGDLIAKLDQLLAYEIKPVTKGSKRKCSAEEKEPD